MVTPTTLQQQALCLADEATVNFYELAGMIVQLHDTGGFQGLLGETSFSSRRLYYLLEVGRFVHRWNIRKNEAESVGWTKLQIIAAHLQNLEANADVVAQCLNLAQQMTAHTLRDTLKRGQAVPRRTVAFRLNTSERTFLNEALVTFGAKRTGRGCTDKDEALIRMVRAAMSSKPKDRANSQRR